MMVQKAVLRLRKGLRAAAAKAHTTTTAARNGETNIHILPRRQKFILNDKIYYLYRFHSLYIVQPLGSRMNSFAKRAKLTQPFHFRQVDVHTCHTYTLHRCTPTLFITHTREAPPLCTKPYRRENNITKTCLRDHLVTSIGGLLIKTQHFSFVITIFFLKNGIFTYQ